MPGRGKKKNHHKKSYCEPLTWLGQYYYEGESKRVRGKPSNIFKSHVYKRKML